MTRTYRILFNSLKIVLLITATVCFTCSVSATNLVTIEQTDNGFKFAVDGVPTPIKGATWGVRVDETTIDAHMDTLVAMGVNSIRTWGTGSESQILYDACARHNISVMAGIWMRHGRPGMEGDDNFDWAGDAAGAEAQLTDAIKWVSKYKDHPAILCWGVGNEVVLNCPNDEAKLAYAKFLQKTCSTLKELDPNHPILSVSAWSISWEWWRDHVPALDAYGINSYGPGVNAIAGMKTKMGIKQPYIITEYGPVGEWDCEADEYGVKQEPDDQEKYRQILNNYKSGIENNKDCLGVYSFNYGDGSWGFAENWLSFKMDGAFRPGYWATREAFTGKKPYNLLPEVSISLAQRSQVKSGEWIDVAVDMYDPEGKDLEVRFFCNLREGGRISGNAMHEVEYRVVKDGQYQIKLPHIEGGIKLYCYVKDDCPSMVAAYTSLELVATGKYEAPPGQYVSMPFYVYKDQGASDNHYTPSGYMGNTGAMEFQDDCTENPYEGKHCIKITYKAQDNWWGLAWQDPANDWGTSAGGYDLKDAKKLVFYVRGDKFGTSVKFGIGLIGQDATFYDTMTADTGNEIITTKKWRKYEIYIKNHDKSRIKTGLVMYGAGEGPPYSIYVDNVHFE